MIKQGAIYAIDFDGQTLIKRVFREANGIGFPQ